MPRNRVLSFMSQWGSQSPDSSSPSSPTPPKTTAQRTSTTDKYVPPIDTNTAQSALQNAGTFARQQSPIPRSPSTPSRARADSRTGGRPLSMVQTYQPPQVDVAQDTPPELQPIFSFLNSHSNKLYQEGYFLKLHDLDSRGRPSPDRTWMECFAQLVGTVLSLWDAAALDAAGVDGEVVPTFINLSDASLKMIESLPMSGAQGGKLQNVLSISTAANNRYLLHFNSYNSLTQWTAGIRLAMFEHATLQEAYTGSLVAGKGRFLNNIKAIMERSRFNTEDWARVRFGAGTPWRRLWFVITPPDEKEYQKAHKMQKKGATYLRSQLPRGDIKFYDTRKITKKTKPIATINDVYAAYAIYPQSKPLIEQSTLVKMEGLVTIHSSPETTAEGFVFIMPEVHPAVTGFEMMLRWLFPVWDTFNLYGRPTRLIADTLDQRGLMFAMPRDRRYGYLDTLDVSGLIHENGSQTWSERQWRKQMKKLTADRMNAQLEGGYYEHRRSGAGSQTSLPNVTKQGVRFDDGGSIHSSPPSRSASPAPMSGVVGNFAPPKRTDSAPPTQRSSPHKRSASEAHGYKRYQAETPSRLSQEMARQENYVPIPPRHASPPGISTGPGVLQRIESGLETPTMASMQAGLHPTTDAIDVPPAPVNTPPAFTHNPSSRPVNQPAVAPELRRAHSGVDAATLSQMHDAAHPAPGLEHDFGNLTMVDNPNNAYRNTRGSNTDRSQGSLNPTVGRSPSPITQLSSTILSSPHAVDILAPTTQRAPPSDNPHPLPLIPQEQPQRPLLPPSRSSQSIARKPVARKPVSPAMASPKQSSTPSPEHEGLANSYIDHEALERILQDDARLDSMGSIASSATPDYASTRSGASKAGFKTSIEKPRTGRLKTVGDPDLSSPEARAGKLDTWTSDQQASAADIPRIDFGPTYSYSPNGKSTPNGETTPNDGSRSRLRNRLSAFMQNSTRSSPGQNNNRHSYFGVPSDNTALDQPGNRSSIVWTPGAASAANNSRGLTPEEWVQYRAAIANQPQLAPRISHSRQGSASTIMPQRKLTKTPPPFARQSSGDWSQPGRNTPPSRPNSRGASTYFGQSSPNASQPSTPPVKLTAKEQMHVARATGTPLLQSGGQRYPQESDPPGLLGAMAMREREKAAAMQGLRNGSVDEAIRSRQQQHFQNNAEALRHQAMLVQQHQQAAQAYQYQQSMYPRSAMGASTPPGQLNRQSWISGQGLQQASGYDSTGYTNVGDQPYQSNPQQQTYVAQQGQQHMPRQQPNQSYYGT